MRRIGSSVVSWLVVVALTALLSSVSMSFAAVLNDEVTSIKLKEADGTSSQNTNSGSGVKTGHIQNMAVTNAKLFGNISGSKLMNSTVTGAKIAAGTITGTNLTAGAVATTTIVDGAVTTIKIGAGAVTDAKITGPIAGSKLGAHAHNSADIVGAISISNLPVGTTSGTVAAGDHVHDSVYQKKYANLIVVAKSGGDFTDPVAAVNSILDASPSNPYLVKIMPGTYDLSQSGGVITTRPNVDIEGSGENMTTLTGSAGPNTGLIYAISDSEIRSLTIESLGGVAFYSYNSSPTVKNVKVLASGQGPRAFQLMNGAPVLKNVFVDVSNSIGSLAYGIYDRDNTPSFENVSIKCSGTGSGCVGIAHDGGNPNLGPKLNNVTISCESPIDYNWGIYTQYTADAVFNNVIVKTSNARNFNTAMTIQANNTLLRNVNATASGSTATGIVLTGIGLKMEQSVVMGGVHVAATNGSVFIGTSRIEGNIIKDGPLTCYGVYDANFAPVTCP